MLGRHTVARCVGVVSARRRFDRRGATRRVRRDRRHVERVLNQGRQKGLKLRRAEVTAVRLGAQRNHAAAAAALVVFLLAAAAAAAARLAARRRRRLERHKLRSHQLLKLLSYEAPTPLCLSLPLRLQEALEHVHEAFSLANL